MTQRPTGTMRPDFSSSGRKSWGKSIPVLVAPGSCQRSRASTPMSSPESTRTIGW